MKISIGVTAYNAEKTIESALLSAAAQDWADKEIIVVDDCSTDNTWTTILLLQEKIPSLRALRNERNLGVAASRNRIISESRGDFIAFFDDDDTSVPERLSRQYERIINYERDFSLNSPVICHSARLQIYPDGSQRIEPTMGTIPDQPAPQGLVIAKHILLNHPIKDDTGSMAACSQMARKNIYEILGGFDSAFRRSEDTEFNFRLALAKAHFVGIEEPLVHQTMTLDSDKKLSVEREFMLRLYRKHKDFLELHSHYNFNYQWIDAKYDFLEGQKIKFILRLVKLCLIHPVMTTQRLFLALPNFHYNMLLQKFHVPRT
ncbi:MAG: glycosyltransferase family 2 protein [Micavibrio sp.]